MRLSIRMKIFLPMLLILVAFPMAVWIGVRATLNGHMDYSARRDLEAMVRRTEELIQEQEAAGNLGGDADDEEDDGESGTAGTSPLLAGLRSMVQTESGETKLLALGNRYRVIFPKNYDDQPEMTQIYSLFLSKVTPWPEKQIVEEKVGGKDYLFYYRVVDQEDENRVRHIILYCPVFDTTQILDEVSRLVLTIMGIVAVAALVLFWFVAGSISKPVRKLCQAARGIGEKKYQKVETGATVRELCELEDEINQMQSNLIKADEAERIFFQNASHELRTPLMSISGYAQGIQRGVFDDVSQAAGVILDESGRLTEVVDGILALTRMDQLRYQVVPVEIEVNEFIETQFERLEGLAYSKKVRLVFEPGEEIRVISDVMLLERTFSNVMSNCIRYARTKVHVCAALEDGWLKIAVEDDGPGFEGEDLSHLFDRFYKGKNGNHGLGLAIAKRSMEYIGGDILAEEGENGACFILIVPQDCRSFAVEEQRET